MKKQNSGGAYSGSDKPMDNTKSDMGGGQGGGQMKQKSGGIMTGEYDSKMGGGSFNPGPDSPLNKGPYNK